jgi:predicted dehydrogenase
MDEIIQSANEKSLFIGPSCTLLFHPAIQKIKEIISNDELGIISNIIYHSGQYLPDWHTYEHVKDYYVSNPETGGAREIVPFELSWITQVFGFPIAVTSMYKKTINIEGAEKIDDTYNILMDYDKFIFNLNVDVVSRYATRNLMINGSEKQLVWNWSDNQIKIYNPNTEEFEIHSYETINAESGYNKNITEQMYIDEINYFISRVKGEKNYPNTLENDHKILNLLYASETSYKNKIISKL